MFANRILRAIFGTEKRGGGGRLEKMQNTDYYTL
jgi:hypothetical protein